MKDYLIPSNVQSRFEFFPGFGWLELGFTIGGIAIGGSLFFLINIFTQIFLVKFLPGMFITAVMFLGSMKNPRTGFSPFMFFKKFRQYKQKQNRFFYVFGSGGKLNDQKAIRKKQ